MELPVDAEGWLELCVRCWDDAMNTQPTFVRSSWYDFPFHCPFYHFVSCTDASNRNWDLHVTSSCHRIKIFSINRSRPKTAAKLKMFQEMGVDILPITRPGETDLEDEETYAREMEARGGRDPID